GVSLFGGLFAWVIIFVTHIFFRPKWNSSGGRRLPVRMIGYPFTSIAGCAAIIAIIATMWWVEGMRVAILAGLPWLAVLTVAYFVVTKTRGLEKIPKESA